MFRRRKKQISPFLLAFLCSLFIHSSLFFLNWKSLSIDAEKEYEDNSLILVEYPAHRQIVSQEKFNKVIPKKHTSYLSQSDKAVEKETQAMLKGLFYQAETENLNHSIKKNKINLQSNTSSRKISSLEPELLKKINAPLKVDIGQIYRTDFSQQSKQAKASRTMDFLPGIEFGSHTLLNTKEFTYYSYFSRMKEQLYWQWTQYFRTEPQLLSLGIFNGNKQRLFSTSLYVYLSPNGEVQDIQVVKSSGEENIDTAALHAFLSAAPFPNPPPELVEEDGYIHIKQSFHLYISPSSFADLFSRHSQN